MDFQDIYKGEFQSSVRYVGSFSNIFFGVYPTRAAEVELGIQKNFENFPMSDIFTFVCYEKNLPEKQDQEIQIAEDANYGKPGAKRFAFGTWQVVYDSIYTGYQAGKPRHLYEYRDPLKACNFYVDIDAEFASKSEYDEDKFLETITTRFC